LTTLGQKAALAGARLTWKSIEAALNDPSKSKAERVSKKIYGTVLDQMVTDGLFTPLKVGNADHWTWVGPVQDDEEELPF
jgi:hypothetical protein